MIIAYKMIRKDGVRLHCIDLPTLINAVVNELETMDLQPGDSFSIHMGAYETTQESFDSLPCLGDDE